MTAARKPKRVHPYAERFPMRSDAELEELAASIQQHGQRLPITLDKDGTLLDGRNRLAACRLAGVEPTFTVLPADEDPIAFIVDMNLTRRDLLKSQHAMLYAIAYPDPTPAEHRRNSKPGLPIPVSKQLLSYARTVLREFGVASNEVTQIVAGASLKDAYHFVLAQRKRQQELAVMLDAQRAAYKEAEREMEHDAARRRREVYLQNDVKEAIDWFKQTYTTHPVAVFPLLFRSTPTENAEAWALFVDSIRRCGLLSPVVRDSQGRIVDGCLRLIGCRLAGVEPWFTTLADDEDPARYVISANVMRMHDSCAAKAKSWREQIEQLELSEVEQP
jgi:phosphoglycolate phosphatase-like HAD superfamily hydrolase